MQVPYKILSHVLAAGVLCVAMNFAAAATTSQAGATKVALAKPEPRAINTVPAGNGEIVFGAAPHGSHAEDSAVYQPIADYLSRVTGKHVVFRHADSWLSYSKNMTSGAYDLVFDDPALNGWRLERIDHRPLVKLSDDLVFVVLARADDAKIKELKQLAGHRVCAGTAPNLGTLTFMSQFDNPVRRPVILESRSWDESYQNLADGKCSASIVPLKYAQTLRPDTVKVLYQHRPLPNQAFSAGPRISTDVQEKIRAALLSDAGKEATAKLREIYAAKELTAASSAEYAGLGKLLRNELYYY